MRRIAPSVARSSASSVPGVRARAPDCPVQHHTGRLAGKVPLTGRHSQAQLNPIRRLPVRYECRTGISSASTLLQHSLASLDQIERYTQAPPSQRPHGARLPLASAARERNAPSLADDRDPAYRVPSKSGHLYTIKEPLARVGKYRPAAVVGSAHDINASGTPRYRARAHRNRSRVGRFDRHSDVRPAVVPLSFASALETETFGSPGTTSPKRPSRRVLLADWSIASRPVEAARGTLHRHKDDIIPGQHPMFLARAASIAR
jgi:hypothetical protein